MLKIIDKSLVEGCRCKEAKNSDISKYNNGTIEEMFKIMRETNDIGLAAPQVGIFKRFFVMSYGDRKTICFNPKILFKSPQKSAMQESCLTYNYGNQRPSQNIMRPKTIRVEFQDENKEMINLKLTGLEAKCFQHELDHLNGITIFYRG